MNNNQDKNDPDKILGMNRPLFLVIVALLCILSLCIGIYAQIFYRYSDTDPLMLGIGVGSTQDAEEITKLKNDFSKIFTNDITGESTVSNISKKEDSKDIVYTYQTTTEKEDDEYNVSTNIPKINISSSYADKINNEIDNTFVTKVSSIIEGGNTEYIDYSVTYKAYINGDLLSLIIKETIREGNTTQKAKITTYNYNLSQNSEATIMQVIEAKGYDSDYLQKEIDNEIEELNEKDEELKSQYYDVRIRDVNDDIYKVENTENFLVNAEGYLYFIYAYGNREDTNKIDVIIFE